LFTLKIPRCRDLLNLSSIIIIPASDAPSVPIYDKIEVFIAFKTHLNSNMGVSETISNAKYLFRSRSDGKSGFIFFLIFFTYILCNNREIMIGVYFSSFSPNEKDCCGIYKGFGRFNVI
jgi:hypothetical protein